MPKPIGRVSHAQAGFSLTEALVSTALTLIVVSASMGLFNSTAKLADTARIVSETNQTLQVALNLMVRDFIQTGSGVPKGGVPLPSGAGSTPVVRPGPPNSTFTFPAGWTTLPAVAPGASMGPTLLGVQTDVVSVLFEDPTITIDTYPLVDVNGNANTVRVDPRTPIDGPDGLKPGDLLLFSNPLGTALRMVTQVVGGVNQQVNLTPNDPLNLNQPNASQGSLQNLETSPNAYPPTTATRVLLISYYIDAVTDPSLPRLVRQVNAGTPRAIALGIENLQVTFDLVDGVLNPTNVDTPPAINSPHQIRKVNLFLSGRSLDRNPRSHDYFHTSVATQVGLRSLSFVNRYQ